jgi:hypothetical protein
MNSSSHYISYEKITFQRIKAAIIYTSFFFYKDYPGAAIFNIFVITYALFTILKKSKKGFVFLLANQLIFLALLILVNIIMKLPDRLFVPIFEIYTIYNIFIIWDCELMHDFKKYKTAIIVVVVSVLISMISLQKRIDSIKSLNKENEQCFLYLSSKFNNTTFLLSYPSSILLDKQDPMNNFSISSNKVFPLIGWTTIMPSYYNELKKICNSTEIIDFYDFVKDKPGFILISNDIFNSFLSTYLRMLYSYDLRFEVYQDTPGIFRNRNLYFYRITNNLK